MKFVTPFAFAALAWASGKGNGGHNNGDFPGDNGLGNGGLDNGNHNGRPGFPGGLPGGLPDGLPGFPGNGHGHDGGDGFPGFPGEHGHDGGGVPVPVPVPGKKGGSGGLTLGQSLVLGLLANNNNDNDYDYDYLPPVRRFRPAPLPLCASGAPLVNQLGYRVKCNPVNRCPAGYQCVLGACCSNVVPAFGPVPPQVLPLAPIPAGYVRRRVFG